MPEKIAGGCSVGPAGAMSLVEATRGSGRVRVNDTNPLEGCIRSEERTMFPSLKKLVGGPVAAMRHWLGTPPRRRARSTPARRRPSFRPDFEGLEERSLMTVTYHGGALLNHVELQTLYYGKEWYTNPDLYARTAQFDSFLSYLATSPYMDMLDKAAYNVGRGSAQGGKIYMTDPGSSITDSDIRAGLQAAITNPNPLSHPDANRFYVVYIGPNIKVTNDHFYDPDKGRYDNSVQDFAGYHQAFTGTGALAGTTIRYAVVTTPGGTVNNGSSNSSLGTLDEMTMATSHEIAEGVTDPDVNYALKGWYDDDKKGEIGDLAVGKTVTLSGWVVQKEVDWYDNLIIPADLHFQAQAVRATVNSPVTAVFALGSDSTGLTNAANLRAFFSWDDGSSNYGTVAVDGQGHFLVTNTHTFATTGEHSYFISIYDNTNSISTMFPSGTVTVSPYQLWAGPVPSMDSIRYVTVGGTTFGFGLDGSAPLFQAGSLAGWQSIPGSPDLASLSAVNNYGTSIKLFGLGKDGTLYVRSFTAQGTNLVSTSTWLAFAFPGQVSSFRTAVCADGRALVLVVTADGNLFASMEQTVTSAGFQAVRQFSGTGYTDAQAVRRTDGRLAVFTRQSTGTVKLAVQTALSADSFASACTFSNPAPGVTVQSLAADVDGAGRLELFAVGSNHRLYLATEQAANAGYFPGWTDFNHNAVSVAVSHNADGRLQVFVADTDGGVYFQTQTKAGTWQGNPWVSFTRPGGLPVYKVEARNENGIIVVRAYTKAPGYIDGVWVTAESALNRSDSGWPSWVRLAGGIPITVLH
jgi:hypothetical protein